MVKFKVPSSDPSKPPYDVEITSNRQTCKCVGFIMRQTCRHIKRASEYMLTHPKITLDYPEVIVLASDEHTKPKKLSREKQIIKEMRELSGGYYE